MEDAPHTLVPEVLVDVDEKPAKVDESAVKSPKKQKGFFNLG
tara:strand:- start:2673 stop:2798 length:126 start_codon:yes stop_codon:yes gene_type:complete